MRRLDLVASEDLLDEQEAVRGDRHFRCRPVCGSLEREEQGAVLGDIVGRVAEGLEVLLGGLIALGRDVDARAGRTGVAASGTVDESAESHGA